MKSLAINPHIRIPANYRCAICNEMRPEHNKITRFWDAIHGLYNAHERLGIRKRVDICRMCAMQMRRKGYTSLGVLHYRQFLDKSKKRRPRKRLPSS